MADKKTSAVETVTPVKADRASLRWVQTKNCRVDRKRNVRSESKYTKESLKDLIESLMIQGFNMGCPVLLSDHGEFLLTLQGHRRITAAEFANVDQVYAVVYKGLSEADEYRIMIDHGREDLDEVEWLEAVRRLMESGMGRKTIMAHLKKKDQWVQTRMELLRLPAYMQEQWKLGRIDATKCEINVTADVIRQLSAAALKDRESGTITDEVNYVGPAFMEELEKVKETGKTTKQQQRSAAATPAQLENLAETETRVYLKKLFLFLAGKGGDLSAILNVLREDHDKCHGRVSTEIPAVFQQEVAQEVVS